MVTRRIISILCFFMIVCLGSGLAYGKQYVRKYEVTITNLTHGQVFSPPIVITHKHDFILFDLGEMASEELAALWQWWCS